MRRPSCLLRRFAALLSLAVLTACPEEPSLEFQPSIQGTAREGQTLTVTLGDWSQPQGVTVTYQWERCTAEGQECAAVPSANGMQFLLAAADVGSTLQVLVSATDADRTSESRAPRTGVILPLAPTLRSPPTLSGEARVGSTLTGNSGSWASSSSLTYGYQWLRCDPSGEGCTPVGGATASSYVLSAADVDATLRLELTATNAGGSATARSDATARVQAPLLNTEPPLLSGDTTVGGTLTGTQGTWVASPETTYAYQWQRCDATGETCTNIPGATTDSYLLVAEDLQRTIRLAVTATNAGGSATARSDATALVSGVLYNTARPVLSGNAFVGQTLTGTQGTWVALPEATYAYQWQRCDATAEDCKNIPGATADSYLLATEDLRRTIRLSVTATNTERSASVASAPSTLIGSPCADLRSQGPLSPTVATGVSSLIIWNQPSEARLDDGASATATLGRGDETNTLVLTGWGFNLPQHATLRGIRVEVRRSASVAGAILDTTVKLKAPGAEYSNKARTQAWETSPTVATYGGPEDLWNTSLLAPAALNDPSFGIVLGAHHSRAHGTAEARVDSVRVTVFYTDFSVVGPASPTLVVDDASTGEVAWSNPQAAASHDGSSATASNFSHGQLSHYLKATGFGLAMPAGKSPSGVYVEIERSGSVTGFLDAWVSLVKSGAIDDSLLEFGPAWSTQPAYVGHLPRADMGVTLTAADIADPGFGAALSILYDGYVTANEARVDHLRLSVLYDPVEREVTAFPAQATSTSGSRPWSNVDRVLANDNSSAMISAMINHEVSDDLRTSSYGFSIPASARITGIQLDVKRRSLSNVGLVDGRVRLLVGGQLADEDRGLAERWNNSMQTVAHGGQSDDWGHTWTPAEVNGAGFGAALSVRYDSFSGNDWPSVDHMAMTVFYCAQ
ncbi:hypothetical protein [Hyalangium versicolor]|uniref:hypothetical protein n=1 Tax=Hyalangium versicolor TaxID=2861190 RepID=UPI001CCA56C0|nr:hypothetical protein [Hyalangium versicolor]